MLLTSRSPNIEPRTPDNHVLQAKRFSVPQALHPTPPPPPLRPPQARLLPLIPHNLQPFDIPPLPTPPLPPGLPHQTHDRLFLAPTLLYGHVRQVSCIVAFAVVGEGDTDAVGAKDPVEWVRSLGEICKKGDRI